MYHFIIGMPVFFFTTWYFFEYFSDFKSQNDSDPDPPIINPRVSSIPNTPRMIDAQTQTLPVLVLSDDWDSI